MTLLGDLTPARARFGAARLLRGDQFTQGGAHGSPATRNRAGGTTTRLLAVHRSRCGTAQAATAFTDRARAAWRSCGPQAPLARRNGTTFTGRCAMRVSGRRLSRLELGFIAAALLLPVPLVALNGYAAALPAAVERGLGSLVTLDARDDRSGLKASGQASEDGSNAQRSADGSLRITRAGTTSSTDGKTKPGASSASEAAPARATRAAARHPITTNPRTRPATPEARARPAKAAAPPATAKEGRLPLPATLRACP